MPLMTREEIQLLLDEMEVQRDLLQKELDSITGFYEGEVDEIEATEDVDTAGNRADEDGVAEDDEAGKDYGVAAEVPGDDVKGYEEQKVGDDGPHTIAAATKSILRAAIETGNLQMVLRKVAGGLDFTKTATNAFSEVIEKAQEKMDGKVESLPGPMGFPIMTDMWLPMLLNIAQSQEFQHLMANMLVNILKES